MRSRRHLFCLGCLAFALSLTEGRAENALQLRQQIIRIAEAKLLRFMADPAMKEADLLAHLRQMKTSGAAAVVSDTTLAVGPDMRVKMKQGRHQWLPSEMDQYFDQLYMVPTSYEEYFTGTALECSLPLGATGRQEEQPATFAPETKPALISAGTSFKAGWDGLFSDRTPASTRWPTSWLDIYDHKSGKSTGQAIHGWMEWWDWFEERNMGGLNIVAGQTRILSVVPPADQVWPGAAGQQPERMLDVTLATLSDEASGETAQPAPPLSETRLTLLGFTVEGERAEQILKGRKPQDDHALLAELLATKDNHQRPFLTTSIPRLHGERWTTVSARMHQYPTEMPSVPSAWGKREVGTRIETDTDQIALRQALAAPARSEWKLALDNPAIVMWQPRFRDLALETALDSFTGVRLIAAQQIPAVLEDAPSIPRQTTLFVFGIQQPRQMPPETEAPATFEAHLQVFTIPAAEAAQWQAADFGSEPGEDEARYLKMMSRLETGDSQRVASSLVRMQARRRSTLRTTEDFPTATEFDPPDSKDIPRMRPTALEQLPVGSRWELEVNDWKNPAGQIEAVQLTHHYQHSTDRPDEPSLEDTLKWARETPERQFPGAAHLQTEWAGEVRLKSGRFRCLGVQAPATSATGVSYVAFVKVTPAPQ